MHAQDRMIQMKITINITYFLLIAILILLTFSYFLVFIPSSAFAMTILLIDAGILLSGFLILKNNNNINIPLFFLCCWIFIVLYFFHDDMSNLTINMYKAFSGFVAYTITSTIALQCKTSKFKNIVYITMIVWSILFILFVPEQRTEYLNWGYSNYCYMFLLLFPLVFLSNHKTFQIILSILVVFAVISSLKRTGVIVLCVYAVYFVLMMLKRNKWKVKNIILMSIIFILLMLLFVYTDIFQNTYDEYFYRFEESDGGSLNGRVDIWRNGLETWKNDGLIRMLFGGKSYVYTIKGEVLSFHNDYLETLCNFGIIGAIFLVAFIVNMFQIRSLILAQHRKNILRAWDLSIINILTLGIVSHVIYYPQLMFLQMLVMGYCHGTIKRSIQE